MKNIKLLIMIIGVTTLFLNAGFAGAEEDAQGFGKHCNYDKGAKVEKFMEELGLTEEQKQEIKEVRAGNMEAGKAIREQLRAKREELRAELNKPVSDGGKLDAIVEDVAGLTKEKMKHRINGVLTMKEILTPEQYQLMQEKHKARRVERKGSRQRYKGKFQKQSR